MIPYCRFITVVTLGSQDDFINVSGNYRKSCFACSLDYLIRFREPIRTAQQIVEVCVCVCGVFAFMYVLVFVCAFVFVFGFVGL